MISNRYEERSPWFHSPNTSAISAAVIPNPRDMMSYASAIVSMIAYSIPLCTIFT